MLRKIPLHVQILIGMSLGLGWGILSSTFGWSSFSIDWIKPFGVIFVNLLKVIATPLVIITIIWGIASLSDIQRLAVIGRQTLGWFAGLTILSATIGLVICLIVAPGKTISEQKREQLKEQFAPEVSKKVTDASEVRDGGPLQIIKDIVPENFFLAATNNRNMLQVIFFSILFGVGMVMAPKEKTKGLASFISGTNDVLLNVVKIVMRVAPIGVFALLAGLIADMAGDNTTALVEMVEMLGIFALSFVLAIVVLMSTVYPFLVKRYLKMGYIDFLKKMMPASLVAFSTSSSAATLPVTMDCTENRLKVKSEITGFVLPLGVTMNMHGTAVHQGLCAVFIAQAFGHDLTIAHYFIIVFTSTLAAMGAPGVPGSGLIMMLMVFNAVGIPEEGLALIIAIDRPLDMLRTIPNVLGDTIVAGIVGKRDELNKANSN